MYKKLVSYHHDAFTCCILVLNIFPLSRESEQKSAINFSPKIASSPPRLRVLAKSEEIIYILIKDFYTTYGSMDRRLNTPTEELLKLVHSYLRIVKQQPVAGQLKLTLERQKQKPMIITVYRVSTMAIGRMIYVHNYLENFEATTGQLKLKLERQNEKRNDRALKAAWNPLTTYLMFQRFLKPLREILVGLNATGEAEFALRKQIDLLMEISGWPTKMDLQFAIKAIVRIQDVYDLSTFDLSVGKIAGYETGVNLTAVDCVEIGKQALLGQEEEPYNALVAVEWFELGQRKLKHKSRLQTTSGSTSKTEIEHYINLSQGTCVQNDDHWYKSKKSEPLFFTAPFDDAAIQVRKRASEMLQVWEGSTHVKANLANYRGTCSGANFKSEYEKSKLFCWYETEVNPLFKINPLKAELLSFKPLLVIQYYDLIGDKMIEKIIRDSSFHLQHSSVLGYVNNGGVLSSLRTSSNSWVMDTEREKFFPIPDTIGAVTGLKVRNPSWSEMLQISAYTIGGHYALHRDARGYSTEIPSDDDDFVDRIATFMFYLTDVEKGGGTSFPQSGIAAAPIKGSAVLWYNFLRNGATDEFTYHGACPVVIGEKWIASKWINSRDQMFLKDYQCVPDQTARYMIRVNGKDLMDFF